MGHDTSISTTFAECCGTDIVHETVKGDFFLTPRVQILDAQHTYSNQPCMGEPPTNIVHSCACWLIAEGYALEEEQPKTWLRRMSKPGESSSSSSEQGLELRVRDVLPNHGEISYFMHHSQSVS